MSRKYKWICMGMKYLKLYESFQEEDIHTICKKYGITNYKINDDFSVDVDGNVDLSYKELKKLPLKFGEVNGNFECDGNELSNLEGCPTSVGGNLWCHDNKLTSLEGCPKEVVHFYCSKNKLTSLKGCPEYVEDDFYCENNDLTSLEGCPKEVGNVFNCCNNQLTTLEHISKIGGYFYCDGNPVYEVYKLFVSKKLLRSYSGFSTSFEDSLDYNYFRGGNKINKVRLTQALAEIGKGCPSKINGYTWE